MLTDSRVVIVWRRVGDRDRATRFIDNVLRWPRPEPGPDGEDPNVTMYDAGGALVGITTQRQVLVACEADCCSAISMEAINLFANPASSLTLFPTDFGDSMRRLSEERPTARALAAISPQQSFPFYDPFGNLLSFDRFPQLRLRGAVRDKLQRVMSIRRDRGDASPVAEVSLMVSDMSRSQEFYQETLGLRPLDVTRASASYDVGTLVLTLRPEPINGFMEQLSASGRLIEDWNVFHVREFDQAMQGLVDRGVVFPRGVEGWNDGRTAYFNDPDGHFLALWEPAGNPTNIDFYPALDRILAEDV